MATPEEPGGGRRRITVPEAREYTRRRGRDLKELVARYVRYHMPPPHPKERQPTEPPRLVGSHARLLPFLQIVPATLASLFVLSFIWDFPGMSLVLFGLVLPLEGLLRIASVAGLIGFVTNWLAITMLFNPREARPIFGQGLIPAQRERVIYRLAQAVSEELINETIIKQRIEDSGVIPRYRQLALGVAREVIEDPGFRLELKAIVSDYVEQVLTSDEVRERMVTFTIEKIEEYAGQGLGGLALKTYRYLNEADFKRRIDEAVANLPGSVDSVLDELDHMLDRIPGKLEAQSEQIETWATKAITGFVENLDVYDMIVTNMNQYDDSKLETLLKRTSNEQLNYIKYLGGVLGFFGGLVIWQPLLSLSVFAAVGGVLYGLDVMLMRRRNG
jgi:hypothetical protein